jgi:hypothetical protein
MKIEYRVRPVTRYIVTRYHETVPGSGGVQSKGEYDSQEIAYQVAYALCKSEHQQLGYPPDDMRIKYPQHPTITSSRSESGD